MSLKCAHLTVFATLALTATTAMAADTVAYRAFVADHANGKITVIDAVTGKTIAHYGVEGPARLKANQNGSMIYASQGAQNRVDVIETGISVTSHGDHADVSAKPPRMTSASVLGPKPSHINIEGGRVAVFFDGDGRAVLQAEAALLKPGKTKPALITTSAPHHGLAAPVGEFIAVSTPHPVDAKELPVGLALLDKASKTVAQSADCPRMHGEARSGATSAFGCADGVLLLRMTRTGGSFEKVAYPATLPTGRMVRNMAGGASVKSFLGDFGPDGMVVIDPVAKDFTFVQLPARRMHFARDAVNGDFGYVITEDGKLHKINALTGKIETSMGVTDAYSMEGGSAVPRPRLSASGDRVVVTDPAKSLVHVIDAAKMQLVHKVATPGAPFDVIVVGATGEDH
jgi:zinc transport system substrate-binding protein